MSSPTLQSRTNATIAYFFMGWIFLLARNNPALQDPYVRTHAYTATQVHIGFIVAYILLSYILFPILNGLYIPFFGISLVYVCTLGFFVASSGYLVYMAHRAYTGTDTDIPTHIEVRDIQAERADISHLSDSEKIAIIASYIPFLGIFVSARYPSIYTDTGVRIGSVLGALLYISSIGSTATGTTMLLGILCIVCIVGQGVSLYIHDRVVHVPIVEDIPSLGHITENISTYIVRGIRFLPTLWWREMSVYTPATDTRDSIDVDTPLPFPTIYIAIPVVNLLCIPLLYNSKYSTWHASICQCIILTVLVLCTYFFGSIYSLCMIFLVCIAIAYIPRGSTYRLPICYQIYTLVRYIVGLFRRTRADISTLQTSTQTAGYTFDTEKK